MLWVIGILAGTAFGGCAVALVAGMRRGQDAGLADDSVDRSRLRDSFPAESTPDAAIPTTVGVASRWLRLWHNQPVVVVSTLSVSDAERRLSDGLKRSLPAGPPGLLEPRVVVGRVDHGRVRLVAIQPWLRNSFRPVLQGHLTSTSDGCQLVGDLGWPPLVRAFSALWLGGVGTFLLGGLVAVVIQLTSGRAHAAVEPALAAATAVAFLAFFGLLIWFAGRMGESDADYLRRWISDRLRPS